LVRCIASLCLALLYFEGFGDCTLFYFLLFQGVFSPPSPFSHFLFSFPPGIGFWAYFLTSYSFVPLLFYSFFLVRFLFTLIFSRCVTTLTTSVCSSSCLCIWTRSTGGEMGFHKVLCWFTVRCYSLTGASAPLHFHFTFRRL